MKHYLNVLLNVSMSLLCLFKINVTFKIIIELKFIFIYHKSNGDFKAMSFLNGHKEYF
jgi:hypothetical protein